MNKKLISIFAVLVIGSCFIGISYSQDSDEEGDLLFTDVKTSDNEGILNVATVSAVISGDGEYIDVAVLNAYPLYKAYIFFNITNTYDTPGEITSIIQNPPYDATALLIDYNLTEGKIIPPGGRIAGLLTVEILQSALQNHPYYFRIDFDFNQVVTNT